MTRPIHSFELSKLLFPLHRTAIVPCLLFAIQIIAAHVVRAQTTAVPRYKPPKQMASTPSQSLMNQLPYFRQISLQGDTSYRIPVFQGIDDLLKDHYKDAKSCEMLFISVRFRVDRTGKVFDVGCSTNTPEFLRKQLIENVEKTSYAWIPQYVNGTAVDSEPIIIPSYIVIAIYKGVCNDLDDLFGKASIGLPVLEFPESSIEQQAKSKIEHTVAEQILVDAIVYKPLPMVINVFPKGFQR